MVLSAQPLDLIDQQILIVEDDEDTAEIFVTMLKDAGYRAIAVDDGEEALRRVNQKLPDLLLVDVVLPGIDGIEVIRSVRSQSYLPVIAVSGQGVKSVDSVRALEAGADDYLTKPFTRAELLARVKANLRRSIWPQIPASVMRVGDIALDIPRRCVTINDGPIKHLTPIEYGILTTLMRNVGRVISHDEMLESVWGHHYREDFSVLRVNISRLRQKIENDPRKPRYILTVPGKGYWMPRHTHND